MSEQLDVLKTAARALESASIPYMLSGSVAMSFYAQPRMTRDIDIVVELGARDAVRLCGLFVSDFYVDADDAREAVENRGIFNIIHKLWMVKIDFIVRKETEYRRKEFSRRRALLLEGVSVFVAAPEDLILSKLDWGKDSRSELQMGDVKNLIGAVSGLDWDYIKRWARVLGVDHWLGEIQGS